MKRFTLLLALPLLAACSGTFYPSRVPLSAAPSVAPPQYGASVLVELPATNERFIAAGYVPGDRAFTLDGCKGGANIPGVTNYDTYVVLHPGTDTPTQPVPSCAHGWVLFATITPPSLGEQVVAFTAADIANARTIFGADTALVDPVTKVNYGVQCIDKVDAHMPEFQALLAPLPALPSFTPPAPVTGVFSGVAAAVLKGDAASGYATTFASSISARRAILQGGVPLDIRAACGMFPEIGLHIAAAFTAAANKVAHP